MAISQYAHPIPSVRPWNDGAGWRVDSVPGEGLLWLVEMFRPDPREGTEDVYVVADTVEVNNHRLEFSLRARPDELGNHIPPTISVRVFAPGTWREYHLITDAKVIAEHTAEMFKEDEDA